MQKYCQNICYKYKINLIIKKIKNINNKKYGLEGYLRIQRYKIYKEIIQDKEILLTGHHLNDQLENLFLSIKRKIGISGLSGIKAISTYKKITIYRPLIHYTKKDIINWAKQNNITWIEDPTNKNIKYDRNFLRKEIIPKILKKWPYFLKNCTDSMNILSQEKKVLDYFIYQYLKKNIFSDGRLSLINLNKIPKLLQIIIIKYWIIQEIKIFPNSYVIKKIQKIFLSKKKEHKKKIIFQKYEFFRYQNAIYFIKIMNSLKNKILIWKEISKPLKLPNKLGYLIFYTDHKKGFSLPKPDSKSIISIQFEISESYFHENYTIKKKIKKIWQNNKIPPWWRRKIPLIFYNKKLISGVGIFRINPKNQKKKISLSWINYI